MKALIPIPIRFLQTAYLAEGRNKKLKSMFVYGKTSNLPSAARPSSISKPREATAAESLGSSKQGINECFFSARISSTRERCKPVLQCIPL